MKRMNAKVVFGAALLVSFVAAAGWEKSAWLAVPNAPVATEADRHAQVAAPGASWFVGKVVNAAPVVSAKWTMTALGVCELYLNGKSVGENDALKPGFTHVRKTRRAFTYDVTDVFKCEKGAENVLAAEVTGGWWRDQIVAYAGTRSAFRGFLELVYADGRREIVGTSPQTWTCGIAGPVKRAAIFDGEIYDARLPKPFAGAPDFVAPDVSTEFSGEILPTNGAEVHRRFDLALAPVEAYAWKDVVDAAPTAECPVFGRVVRTRTFDPKAALFVRPGETLIVDFGQNCAAVPVFEFVAKRGVTLTCLPGEMLNDANGERSRGNDGPAGSLYRENLRIPKTGMRLEYTFASDSPEKYMPRHTFFGYRYVSITATDAVTITSVRSVPVSSITKEMERGKIETGNADVNRLISNVRWGQLSNYLSVPTDCPQRNERLGWTADTQVFAEAGSFNADTSRFFHKWTRDLRDTQGEEGGLPGVAPYGQYGSDELMRFGWSDAGVIVPYQVWKQFGDRAIVDENWAAMEKYMDRLATTKADHAANIAINFDGQFADWLSFEDLESASEAAYMKRDGKVVPKPDAVIYWNYLAACYWLWDARMMAQMAAATGRDTAKWEKMAAIAEKHLKTNFFESDGIILRRYRSMQTPAVFALKLGLVEGRAADETLAALRENVEDHEGCLTTGFLGTSIIMDTLTACGASDLAYDLLLNHRHPSWLYSVDQGATTIWERWNSYTKEKGFGPVEMNSFNHYAYGAVLAWLYKTAAGIAADPRVPGFRQIVMAPVPDRRLGFVSAEYETPFGCVKSAWHYEGEKWIWKFTVPTGTIAAVRLPGERISTLYRPGTYCLSK